MIAAIILTVIASLVYLSRNPTINEIIQRLEAIPYDIRLKLGIPIKIKEEPPIIIIDIDETSLKKEGRWPWSRKKLASLIQKLSDNHTALIMLDIVQSEKEINPASKLKQALKKLDKPIPDWIHAIQKKMDADSYMADALADKEVVLGFPFHPQFAIQTGKLHQSSIKTDTRKINALTILNMRGFTGNLREFTEKSSSSGFINITSEADGVVRRAPLVVNYNNQVYPSLALETARLYLLEDSVKLHTATIGDIKTVTHLSLGGLKIPTDAQGRILIPYLGKQHHFKYISASNLLHSDNIFPELENAIAIIGTSAIALADLRSTPVQAEFPGVEIQANILHSLLHPETIAYSPDWTAGATIVILVLLCILMIFVYPRLQPLSLLIFGTILLFLTFNLNYWLWSALKISFPVVIPLLLIMAISSIYVIYDLLKENKDRRLIHDMFGQYVPLEHINLLLDDPKQITMEGEKREMTVLFSDIRNFTSLSEPLTTRQLKTFLNQYLTPITKIIFKYQGTIDKYVGDMVMAFWGAPLKNPRHATQAVQAALEIQHQISKMQNRFRQIGIAQIAAGIGIHTGEMNVGDMGSDYRRSYTVLGDAVNLGSRLESLTKYYGVKILLSENTKDQCPDIAFRYIDFVRVKGKQDAIRIYEAIALKADLTKEQHKLLKKHEESFKHYLSGNWQTAYQMFAALYNMTDEPLYQLYLERISQLQKTPPENWDGIFTHEKK